MFLLKWSREHKFSIYSNHPLTPTSYALIYEPHNPDFEPGLAGQALTLGLCLTIVLHTLLIWNSCKPHLGRGQGNVRLYCKCVCLLTSFNKENITTSVYVPGLGQDTSFQTTFHVNKKTQ